MESKSLCCIDCRWCWKDDRATDYRRPPFFFCRKKGSFYSRNYRIGEGTRISPTQPVCEKFSPRTKEEES
ncbi:hypothetical protein [Negativibacillus massiliensis]|uniref:hypothetical protein n=1 Tax=Negativibacillus massiliensis TaxID=1871035 RepID=UPI0023F92073|nr:hypothetical protein [Negativibacillus massiliensis]